MTSSYIQIGDSDSDDDDYVQFVSVSSVPSPGSSRNHAIDPSRSTVTRRSSTAGGIIDLTDDSAFSWARRPPVAPGPQLLCPRKRSLDDNRNAALQRRLQKMSQKLAEKEMANKKAALDSAAELKRLSEENSKLAREQELLRAATVSIPERLQAPRPLTWQLPLDHAANVEYVTLDISQSASKSQKPFKPVQIPQETVTQLAVECGATWDCAHSALTCFNNNYFDAARFLDGCRLAGQSAMLLCKPYVTPAMTPAEMESQEETRNSIAAEVETVLKHVGPTKRNQVQQIVRVQNLGLWTKYVLEQQEIGRRHGNTLGANEHWLWHGSNPSVLALITSIGFDTRVANMTGSLGAGCYFAEDISYSLAYVAKATMVGVNVASALPTSSATGQAFRQAASVAGYGNTFATTRSSPIAVPKLHKKKWQHGRPAQSGDNALKLLKSMLPEEQRTGVLRQASDIEPPSIQSNMLFLCRVAIGAQCVGNSQMRRPPDGFDSTSPGFCHGSQIFATYNNFQQYPEYIVWVT